MVNILKITKQSNGLPEWLSTLADVFKEKKNAKAEMQVGNLPTVDWNDNTFYVDVVDGEVILYNQYGNEVLKLMANELGKTDDEDVVSAVDKYLNEHYVTASVNSEGSTTFEKKAIAEEGDIDVDLDDNDTNPNDEMDMVFEQELEKVASMEDGMPEDEGSGDSEGTDGAEQQTATASVEEVEENADEEPVTEETPVTEPVVSDEEPAIATDPVVTEQPEEKAGEPSQGVEDEAGEISEGIDDVVTKGDATSTDDFGFDDVDSEPVEEGCECEECACEGCEEESKDKEGFVSLASYNRLVARLNALEKTVKAFQAEQRAYTDPGNVYDLNCQEEEVKNFQESAAETQAVVDAEHELDMSKMSDRAKLNENFVNEVINNSAEQTEAVNEVVAPAEVPSETNEEVTEEPVATEEAVEGEVVEEPTEETSEEATEEPATEEEVPVEENATEADYVALDEEQLNKFAEKICPFCGKEHLTPVDEVGGVIGVRCDDCGKEFAVSDDEVYTKE